jgi:hypothetical protein
MYSTLLSYQNGKKKLKSAKKGLLVGCVFQDTYYSEKRGGKTISWNG